MKKLMTLLFALATVNVFAADGSSGCGPGWYVAKENSLVSSALRATTNGILFPTSTLGMTLGTSNCTQHKIVRTEKESIHFTHQNYYELMADVARGDGSYLMALSTTIGCDQKSQMHFNQLMQQNYKNVFKNNSNAEKALTEIYKIILNDEALVQSCSLS